MITDFWQNNKAEIAKCSVAMVAPCLQGGPRLVAHCLQWGPRRDTCTEHTMNRCEPCAISRSELVQPRGFWLGFYQRKPPRAAPVKSYPQLKGWAPSREMGLWLWFHTESEWNPSITVLGIYSTVEMQICIYDESCLFSL